MHNTPVKQLLDQHYNTLNSSFHFENRIKGCSCNYLLQSNWNTYSDWNSIND